MYEPSGACPWNLRVPVWGGGCVRPPLWGCRQAALCFGLPPFLPAIARTIKIAEISAGSLVFPGKYWYLQYNCVAIAWHDSMPHAGGARHGSGQPAQNSHIDGGRGVKENPFKSVKNLKPSPALVVWALVIVVVLAAGLTSFFVVDATEQAVVTRLGKYSRTVGAGLQFKLPFGLDRNYNVPANVVQTEQFGFKTISSAGTKGIYENNIVEEARMLTGDLNIVDVEWIIQYKIVDPAAWLFNVKDRTKTIRDISQSVLNMLVGDRAILDVMGSERAPIETQAQQLMNDNFSQLGLGINVLTVRLQNIVPPSGVQDAFEDVNKAIQDMNRFINEGKEAYNTEIPKAQGEADRQIQVAQGYAVERVNKAQGDVARFNAVYEEYRKAPAVTRERLYIETMEEIFNARENPTLIDGELDNVLPVKTLTGGAQ